MLGISYDFFLCLVIDLKFLKSYLRANWSEIMRIFMTENFFNDERLVVSCSCAVFPFDVWLAVIEIIRLVGRTSWKEKLIDHLVNVKRGVGTCLLKIMTTVLVNLSINTE